MKSLVLALTILAAAPAHAGLPNPFTPFTPPKKPVATLPASIQKITIADLQNALADSNAQTPPAGDPRSAQPPYNSTVTAGSDTRHGNCWAALIQFDNAWQTQNILPSAPGLALLQQKIFDDQALAGKPLVPDYVVQQCALTFTDGQMELAKVLGLLGIKAVALPKL